MNQSTTTHHPTHAATSAAAVPQRRPRDLATGSVGGACRVAVIASTWHHEIVASGTRAIRAEFARHGPPGAAPVQVDDYQVPGAFEMPLLAQRLAQAGRHDAVVCCGLVVNGGIYRHEFVASAVIDGLMQVQLATGVPVLSAVLTPRDFHAHEEHQQFFEAHFVKKGTEVAQACLATLALHRQLASAP